MGEPSASRGKKRCVSTIWTLGDQKNTSGAVSEAKYLDRPLPFFMSSAALSPSADPGKKITLPRPESVPDEAAVTAKPRGKGRAMILILLVLATVATLGFRAWMHGQIWVSTDNAYVHSHIHQISPRLAGTVEKVLVLENDAVEEGQALAKLDVRDLDLKLEAARASLNTAEVGVAQAEVHVQEATAKKAQSDAITLLAAAQAKKEEASMAKAKADYLRARSLHDAGNGAISQADLDAAQLSFDSAAATVDAVKAGIRAAQASAASAEAAIQAAKSAQAAAAANKRSAEIAVKDAELQFSYATITSPVKGRIGKKNVEPGNRVQAGQALMGLVESKIWVVANFKETQVGRLAVGQPAVLFVDAFPGREFTGRVESFSPASGAQFALLPPDNATGNFTKVVQRVPVKIALDTASIAGLEGRIVPGMSVVAEVKTK